MSSLAFSAATYSVKENAGLATITVELTGVTSAPVTVTWATSDITATAGSDYGTPATLANPTPPPPSGTLTFPPGGRRSTVRTQDIHGPDPPGPEYSRTPRRST